MKLSRRFFFCTGSTICHIKANRLNYLNKVLVFWYSILPFSFETSTESATDTPAPSFYCENNRTLLHLSQR